MNNIPVPDIFRPLEPLYNVVFHGTHWTAANCPSCGMRSPKDGDRLILYLKGLGGNRKTKAVCRQCGNIWWPDDANKKGAVLQPGALPEGPSPREIAEERKKMYSAWKKMQLGARKWKARGITTEYAKKLRLRYTVRKFWWRSEGKLMNALIPALVIPFFDASGNLLNLQYRLLEIPPSMNGKYRWHSRIVPFALFRNRNGKPGHRTWMVEGGIKAAVLAQDLYMRGHDDLVYGSSQNSINASELAQLGDEELVIYIPDMDVWEKERMLDENIKNIRAAGVDKVITLQLPEKIDDLINRIGTDAVWTDHVISSKEN